MVNLLIVNAKGDIRVNKAAILTAEGLAKALRKPASPTVITTWIVDDGAVELTLWGWRESYSASVKAGVFVFPGMSKKLTLYGDALITAVRDGKPWDLTEDAWIAHCAEIEEMEDDMPAAAAAADGAGADAEDAEEEDSEAEDSDCDDDIEDEEADAEEEEDEEEDELEEAEEEEEEAEEEEEEDDDCYDSDDGGAGKRRAPRRRAMAAPEFRRMDVGLRSRIKMPVPAGKRAPKWQTAPELEAEV